MSKPYLATFSLVLLLSVSGFLKAHGRAAPGDNNAHADDAGGTVQTAAANFNQISLIRMQARPNIPRPPLRGTANAINTSDPRQLQLQRQQQQSKLPLSLQQQQQKQQQQKKQAPKASIMASKGRTAVVEEPPADCGQGHVAYIRCWLDTSGYVIGVAFEGKSGTKAPKLCHTEGESQEGGFLYDGEKILDIISCKGPTGGISHLEFHTDGNRVHPITCGRAGASLMEAAADEGDAVFADAREDASMESAASLQAAAAAAKAAAVVLAASSAKARKAASSAGGGLVQIAALSPSTDSADGVATAALSSLTAATDSVYGYGPRGRYLEPVDMYREEREYQAGYSDVTSAGTDTEEEAEYMQEGEEEAEEEEGVLEAEDNASHTIEEAEWCESLTQGLAPRGSFEIGADGPKMSSKVHFELKELYPVGGLRAECSAQGHITNIKNTCWSPEDKLPSVQGPVLLEVLVQLNDGPAESVRDPDQQEECNAETCADKHTSRQLSAWTATALSHVLERVGTNDVWIKHTTLSCKPCEESSGTVMQVGLAMYAQQGGMEALEHVLKGIIAWPDTNMCKNKKMVIGCNQVGVGTLQVKNVWVKTDTSVPQLTR